jgi:hypothetical protein
MPTWSGNGKSIYLLNYYDFPDFNTNLHSVLAATVGKYGFPTSMRSDEIFVFSNTNNNPRYLSEPRKAEIISLDVKGNFPHQFTYQFSHELGHLMAQGWQRHQKPGQHVWIEEAICGAYSLYCMRALAGLPKSPLQQGAEDYLLNCMPEYAEATIDAQWYRTNKQHLHAATGLTDTIMLLSRLIADRFPSGCFIDDNIKLADVPLDTDLTNYLSHWASRCTRSENVPQLLQQSLEL